MADHGAGPRATANPEIDITDLFAFPSPERPGHLVLIMNVYPFKHIEATRLLFSDAIDYRIRVRPVRIADYGARRRIRGWRTTNASSASPSPFQSKVTAS